VGEAQAGIWRCRDREFRLAGKPLIMGILNVTPDSFSDGGRYLEPERAVERGLALAREGADIIDVGGESTRPGAAPVAEAEELARVIPVIKALHRGGGAVISVDTRKSTVAEQALAAGARIVNDVSALTADARMAAVVREFRAGAVLMHMRGEPGTMQADPRYEDVVREVRDYLAARLAALAEQGIAPEALAIDPGFGFGKTAEHNLRLLAGLGRLRECRRPIVVGVSRKRFIGSLTGREVGERLAGSLGALAYAIMAGAAVLRVHDVRESRDVRVVMTALMRERQTSCNG
jgi:dihydropteroate synthase